MIKNKNNTDKKIEIWETIPGFENYQINTFGRVKRIQQPTLKISTFNYFNYSYKFNTDDILKITEFLNFNAGIP